MENETTLLCPECQALLPNVRIKTPWCECGWSSITEEELAPNRRTKSFINSVRNRKHAKILADIDSRILQSPTNSKWRFLQRTNLILTTILCLPIFLLRVIFWGALVAALAFTLWHREWGLSFLMTMIIAGAVAAQQLTKQKPREPQGILLDPKITPELFKFIDQVAVKSKMPTVNRVRVFLDARFGIRQYLSLKPSPHFEAELNLGILAVYSLTITQLKAVLVHEMAHLQNQDTKFLLLVNNAIQNLGNFLNDLNQLIIGMFNSNMAFGFIIGVLSLVALFFVRLYFFLLVWISRWVMRQQEYFADRKAAQEYGKSALLQALISLKAIEFRFFNYLPSMIQYIENKTNEYDFYYQFVQYSEKMNPIYLQGSYAKALVSFRSVYDTHPSYQDRYKALLGIRPIPDGIEENPSIALIPNAFELGRELTIQVYRYWAKNRY